MHGHFFSLYKPVGISSFKALGKFKRMFDGKVGHMGTLDPLAEGVLPVAVKEATKLIDYVEKEPKVYEYEMYFGVTTESLDAEGVDLDSLEIVEQNFSEQDLRDVLDGFLGTFMQKPPAFSAVKIEGKRAYKLARSGKISDEDLDAREVEVFDIELLEFNWPRAKVKVFVGTGFYVRSLVRDVADKLGSKAFALSINRLSVGNFGLDNVVYFEDFESGDLLSLMEKQIPAEEVLADFVRLDLSDEMYDDVKHGREIPADKEDPIVFAYYEGKLVSVLEKEGNVLKVKRNLK